jgi:hypothetical protein
MTICKANNPIYGDRETGQTCIVSNNDDDVAIYSSNGYHGITAKIGTVQYGICVSSGGKKTSNRVARNGDDNFALEIKV